ncbi:MAG: AbrB/MazE/SpoVT family DNA-binding domain-containing protein [Rhodospirillales bacterium]|jgi:AbrB family looped-hinge helix DNA binding protein|nr:AbrB/MazE/SpoVT family DNA-binding domain-containing protein [Rhodospirillales bacterium]MDK9722767.1 type II toxin-antitoxin system PrlF family antitoxin [Rhodospirillales bacterium]
MASAITQKGQVTLPKTVRDYLGVTPGALVEFVLGKDGQVMVVPASPARRKPNSRFAKLRGQAGEGMSTKDIMKLTRGD